MQYNAKMRMRCENAKKFASHRIAFFRLKTRKSHRSIALSHSHLHRITSPAGQRRSPEYGSAREFFDDSSDAASRRSGDGGSGGSAASGSGRRGGTGSDGVRTGDWTIDGSAPPHHGSAQVDDDGDQSAGSEVAMDESMGGTGDSGQESMEVDDG